MSVSAQEITGRAATIRRAAYLAPKAYPGPVGIYLQHELGEFESLGARFGGSDALMWQIIRDILEKTED